MLIKLNKKGFTLVEIMIVVAIIGLLAAIAIPNLLRAQMNARDQAVRSDLRTFSSAMESFRAAQNPPAYVTVIGSLTTAVPPYVDSTWTSPATKRGHALTFAFDVAGYNAVANTIDNQSAIPYCIDGSGVLYTTTTGAFTAVATVGCLGVPVTG